MALEAFIVTVDATGAGARVTADPANAERLITGVAPTKAYMVAKGWGRGGKAPKMRDSGGRRGRQGKVENAVGKQRGWGEAIESVWAADVKRRAGTQGKKKRRKELRSGCRGAGR